MLSQQALEFELLQKSITEGMKEGLLEPMKAMVKQAEETSKLREEKAEARYNLTQKKLDVIEEKLTTLIQKQ